MTSSSSSNTPLHHTCFTGICISFAEVVVGHPLWTIKTRLQMRESFPRDPRVLFPLLYRGALAEGIAMCPIDVIQMVVSTVLNERVFQNRGDASFGKKVASAWVGGAVGGLMINTLEAVMVDQQKSGDKDLVSQKKPDRRFLPVLRSMIQTNPKRLFVGAFETAMRNSIYNTGFFALTPLMASLLQKKIKQKEVAVLTSGILSGCLVSLLTQPLDVIKTYRQAKEEGCSIPKAVTQLYLEDGLRRFYVGLFFRSLRVVSGIAAMGLTYHYTTAPKSEYLA